MLFLACIGSKSSSDIWHDYKYPYKFYNVKCYGNESSFLGCQYDTTGSCFIEDAIAVFCHESKYNDLAVVRPLRLVIKMCRQ